MKIGLMSDTHGHLDERIFEHFKDVDEVWHAGDIGSHSLADQLEHFKPFRAVYGNIDDHKMRLRYPEHLRFDCEGLDIWMTHIGGYPGKFPARIKNDLLIAAPNLFICGHSHILKIIPDSQFNLLHINPGACGIEGWHKIKTLVRFEVKNSKIQDLEIIELGKRGALK
jgi:hypothetical protein